MIFSGDDADVARLVASLLGGLAALIAISAAIRSRYRRTFGRRSDRYDRLARLGTGAQLSFFNAVLGEPPAIRRTITKNGVDVIGPDHPNYDWDRAEVMDGEEGFEWQDAWAEKEYTECFFIDRDFYVQTISDREDTILAFSVTIRRRRFRPTLVIPRRLTLEERIRCLLSSRYWPRPLATVRLGRTTFADLDSDDPDHWAPPHFRAGMGARWMSYSEFHSFGNPGHYQTYVLSAGSNAPGRGEWHLLGAVLEQAGFEEWPYPLRWDPEALGQPPDEREEPEWEEIPAAATLRRRTVITAYTVIGPGLWEVNFPSQFGPHGDEVRTLP